MGFFPSLAGCHTPRREAWDSSSYLPEMDGSEMTARFLKMVLTTRNTATTCAGRTTDGQNQNLVLVGSAIIRKDVIQLHYSVCAATRRCRQFCVVRRTSQSCEMVGGEVVGRSRRDWYTLVLISTSEANAATALSTARDRLDRMQARDPSRVGVKALCLSKAADG